MIRTPGLKIIQSGSLIVPERGQPLHALEPDLLQRQDATFDYRLPLDVNVGLAWRSKAFEAEADLRYHGGHLRVHLLSSSKPVSITTTDPGGNPVYTTQPFPGVTNGARTVWNFALGVATT